MPLRPLRPSELPSLIEWLPQIAAELDCDRWLDEQSLRDEVGGALLYTEPGSEAFLSVEPHAPLPEAARINFLAVARGRRRLGLGSRAALALERKLKASVRRIYVRVPARAGLALYFWLRLGYRPLTQREWPVASQGETATWMVRQLR